MEYPLLSERLVADAKSCGKAENRTAAEQIKLWAQLGKTCEENPDLPQAHSLKLIFRWVRIR